MIAFEITVKVRQTIEYFLLIAAVAISRFAFRSRYLYDIDSVNFALALGRFDTTVHQPHPPGYFLYVCLGRLANAIFHDPNAALVAISITASCGAAVMIHALAANWFGRTAATFAGLIFVFSPLAWFHGTVALTYIVEAFFSALAGYVCWRVYCGAAGLIVPSAVIVGLAAGFRPSSLLFLGPLLLFSYRSATRRQAAAGVGALAFTLFAWFIPMIRESGGLAAYISSLLSLWRIVPSKETVFNSSVATSIARLCTIVGISVLCFGWTVILAVRAFHGDRALEQRKTIFTWVWIAPGLLFFTFVFLKFVNSGYLLVLSPPVFAWLGLWASDWYENVQWRKALKIALIGASAAANLMIFLRAPVYCSFREVQRFELELESIQRALPQIASPQQALIVGFDSHFLGYRHAGYYLPDYLTVQFPEVRFASGRRVFAMQHRDTQLTTSLPVAACQNFILFPLPSGDNEYREYVLRVRARFPKGELRTIVAGNREFITGPIADLPLLFPVVASSPASVYTELHFRPGSVNCR